MILGVHLILSAYGFWLPNDPRGSWSDFVGSWELLRFGRATRIHTRASVAHLSHDRARRLTAKESLVFPVVSFTGVQALAVGQGFAQAVRDGSYVINACSILPTHAHLVIRRHPTRSFQQIATHLKAAATRQLRERRLDPMQEYSKAGGKTPSVWGRKIWKVFIDDEAHFRNAVSYVIENPVKEGKPPQCWSFVAPYQ